MIPTVSTVSILPPVTLVNTSVPGSIALRAPIDSVAPSVSSAQLDNNARGSSTALAAPAASSAAAPSPADSFALLPSSNSADGIATAQTNFFAQLIGQGGGQDAHSLLVVYERLVENSQVRYKPSNADLPAPAPSGVYGRILQQEKQQVQDIPQIVLPQPRAATTADAPAAAAASLPVIRVVREEKTTATTTTAAPAEDTSSSEEAPSYSYTTAANAAPLPTKAASAYVTTQARPALGDGATLESA